MRKALPAEVLTVLVALGAFGCAGTLPQVPESPGEARLTRPALPLAASAAGPAAPAAEVTSEGLAGVVESLRGLRFRRHVPVLRLPGGAFDARVRAATEAAPINESTRLVRRVFGVGPRERAPHAAVGQGRYVGLYDFHTHELVVRSDLGAREDGVVAHELVHALQDQHFGLPGEDAPPDETLAREALYEGDAVLLRERLAAARAGEDERTFLERALSAVERLPAEDIARAVGASERVLGARKDLRAEALFPYVAGFRFAARRYLAGGNAALDAAYADPPRSTREILHPEEAARTVPLALPDLGLGLGLGDVGTLQGDGALGEARTSMVLERCGIDDARRVAGFAADRFVALGALRDRDAPTTLVWLTAWRSSADATRFAAHVTRARACFPAGADARFSVVIQGERVALALGPAASRALAARAVAASR